MAIDTFTDGREYEITCKAFDLAGSTQTVPDTFSFIYYKGNPTVGVTKPLDTEYYRSITQISGTAQDNMGLDRIEVRISSGTDYWNGTNCRCMGCQNPHTILLECILLYPSRGLFLFHYTDGINPQRG